MFGGSFCSLNAHSKSLYQIFNFFIQRGCDLWEAGFQEGRIVNWHFGCCSGNSRITMSEVRNNEALGLRYASCELASADPIILLESVIEGANMGLNLGVVFH